MSAATLLCLLLAASAPASRAQAVDPRLDENGNLSQPAEPQTPAVSNAALRRVIVPVAAQEAQQDINIPSRLILPTSQGPLVVDLKAPQQITQAARPEPAAPVSPYPAYFALTVAFFTVSFIAFALLKKKRTVVKLVAPPSFSGEGWSANFSIVRVIGEGGMGVVYEAVDRTLQRKVAIKKMREEVRNDPARAENFLKEARTVAAMHHPNIVDIYSIIAQGGDIYLVFEFVEGRTVESVLRERRRLALGETKAILGAVCQALDFAHGRNVIHRDLKPANVMINTQGVIKVMDFGIARQVQERIGLAGPENAGPDTTNTIIGTPRYMAPEAEYGVLCPESDIYALGIMAYQMSTGALPFPDSATLDIKSRRDYPKPSTLAADLPAQLDALVYAALDPDFRARIHTAREFGDKLAAL